MMLEQWIIHVFFFFFRKVPTLRYIQVLSAKRKTFGRNVGECRSYVYNLSLLKTSLMQNLKPINKKIY